MAVNDQIPVNRDEYWYLRISGSAWEFVLVEKLIKPLEKQPQSEMPYIAVHGDAGLLYLLRKKFVPVELLMTHTGLDKDTLEQAEIIELTEKRRDDLPKPTVNYWGQG